MSDVVVSVTESTTAVTVTEQDVAVAVTETSVDVSSSTAGIQGATGATGAGYSGVTSTSTITIGSGLKTFTLVSANQGAFLTGMRIRAIHSDTPTYYMEGTANYVGAGTLIITVDKFNGSGSHNSWLFAVAGEVGQTGATGSSGVVSVTSPITNTGTSGSAIVGIDQTLLGLTRSQISDFTSGTVTSISGTVTQAQVTSLVSDLAGKASLGAANAFTVGGHVITNAATAVIPLVVKGASGQSANLQEWQTNAGATAVLVNSAGLITGTRQLALNSGAAGETSLVIRGAASQTGDTIAVRDSSSNTIAGFSATGRLYSGVSGSGQTYLGGLNLGAVNTVATQLGVIAGASTTVGAVIRGASSQSANLQEWQNSGGTILSRITSIGSFAVPASGSFISGAQGHANFITNDAATTPLMVKGAASQTANLQEWQNSAGTVLANISSAGLIFGKSADATVATASTGVGYMGLPQNTTTTGAYTIVASDAGKHIYSSATRTVTIPANSSVAFPIGTTLTFIAGAGATMTIAITTDTMYLAGPGTTGSRTLAAYGIATAVKTTATTWIISGNGLT